MTDTPRIPDNDRYWLSVELDEAGASVRAELPRPARGVSLLHPSHGQHVRHRFGGGRVKSPVGGGAAEDHDRARLLETEPRHTEALSYSM